MHINTETVYGSCPHSFDYINNEGVLGCGLDGLLNNGDRQICFLLGNKADQLPENMVVQIGGEGLGVTRSKN